MADTGNIKKTAQLSPQNWVEAAICMLVENGQGAVRVEPLARRLSVSKGSFYWHFSDRQALLDAIWQHWHQAALHDIIHALDPVPKGVPRLQALIGIVAQDRPEIGGAQAEPAMRAWARHDAQYQPLVQAVDTARLAFLTACFEDSGQKTAQAQGNANLFYAAHLGGELRGQTSAAHREMLSRLLEFLLA
jgi:AcrR family transcriptional regulator